MSKIWSGLRNGLKFRCTACGKCCNNKRSNVSLNLSEVDKMSEFMGMNKLTFLDKYTEEKIVDGQMYTKLAHKEDLSCILLDIDGKECTVHGARPIQCRSYPFLAEIVLGEAEWRSESKKCEGIRIDSSASPGMLSSTNSAVDESSVSAATSDENILYDGVIFEFENTVHGNIKNYMKNSDLNSLSDGDRSLTVTESGEMTVHPDTIMRQMILHEIHAEGMGPDWNYQDSLELLLESEEQSLEFSSGNVLEDFKNEYCQNNYSRAVYEDTSVRVVDTTTPYQALPDLQLNVENTGTISCLSDDEYDYDLLDLRNDLQLKLNKQEILNEEEKEEKYDEECSIPTDNVTILMTKRRFEFIDSSNMVQTEQFLKKASNLTPAGEVMTENLDHPVIDKNQLIMPIHQVLSVICEKRINNWHVNGNNGINSNTEKQIIAVIGAGGFALPSHLQSIYLDLAVNHSLLIDAVEPENVVLDTAKKFFDADFSLIKLDGVDRLVESSKGKQKQAADAGIYAYHTDGLSYLQSIVKNQSISNKHVDFLIIDAFESNLNEESVTDLGPNSTQYYPTRAPPLSLLSDPSLFVKCLTPINRTLSSKIPHMNSEGHMKNEKNKKTEFLNTVKGSGGLLAINLFGPEKWIGNIFSTISNCPGLSQPILIRLKGQKNILLLTSRIF